MENKHFGSYEQGYVNGESSMRADFNAAFDIIADTDIEWPTDAAQKHLELKKLLSECYQNMCSYYQGWASEFRISTDPPDTEYENLCKRIEAALGISGG